MKKLRWSLTLITLALAFAAVAQDRNTEARNRISEAVQKGDSATAAKLFTELASNLKIAQPGTIPGQTIPVGGSVFFEEIRSCGFYPQETRLECVIDIKQNGGYAGPIGSPGSFEHVAFFADFDGNNTFTMNEYVGSGIVNVTDGSGKTSFAVYRDFNPPGGPRTSNSGASATTTTGGPILRVLARLSWFWPATNLAASQVWGNDYHFYIRMMPVR